MFVYSVKASKKRVFIILIVLAVAVGAVFVFFSNSADMASKTPKVNVTAGTNEERIAFLSQFGWKAGADPLEVREVVIPAVFDQVYQNYNTLQQRQDFDLAKYAEKRVKRWTYAITNYPGYAADSGLVRANLLVYDGKVIGGDICSIELNGFMHGFQVESMTTDASEASEASGTSASLPGGSESQIESSSKDSVGANATTKKSNSGTTKTSETTTKKASSSATTKKS